MAINKLLNYISTISGIVMIISLFIFKTLVTGVEFSGYTILIFISMFLNPIVNIFSVNKRKVKNSIYHIIFVFVTGYTSYVAINSLVIYANNLSSWEDNFDALNTSVNYFGERFIYVLAAIFLTFLLSFLFKKENIKVGTGNKMIMLLIILITSAAPFFTNEVQIKMIWSLSEIIFLAVIFSKNRGIVVSNELQKYYLVLIVLSALSINPIALALSILLFVQLDSNGML